MILTLAGQSGDARQAVFIDEGGHLLYETDTPWKFTHRITTIMKGSLPKEKVAEIEWGFIHNRFRFAGKELEAGDFIPWRGFTRSKRAFHGPDHHRYEWRISDNLSSCELWKTANKCIIALSYDAPPKLEIFGKGYHMLDTIIMTFVFVDHIRRERKQRRDSDNAARASSNAC